MQPRPVIFTRLDQMGQSMEEIDDPHALICESNKKMDIFLKSKNKYYNIFLKRIRIKYPELSDNELYRLLSITNNNNLSEKDLKWEDLRELAQEIAKEYPEAKKELGDKAFFTFHQNPNHLQKELENNSPYLVNYKALD